MLQFLFFGHFAPGELNSTCVKERPFAIGRCFISGAFAAIYAISSLLLVNISLTMMHVYWQESLPFEPVPRTTVGS